MPKKMIIPGEFETIRSEFEASEGNESKTQAWANDYGQVLIDGYEAARDALESAKLHLTEGDAATALKIIEDAFKTATTQPE